MALQNAAYRESTNLRGFYDQRFLSTYDTRLKPQTYGELVMRYGDGLTLTSFLHLAGQEMSIKSKEITIFEKGAYTRPVTVSIPTAAAPINSVAITPSTADDSDDYLRADMTLIIPRQFTNNNQETELLLAFDGSNWTGKALNGTTAITTALTDVVVAVGASAFGYGTGQPDPMNSAEFSRTTGVRIMKDTSGIEGGTVFEEQWDELQAYDGSKGVWTRSLAEMDFRLDDQIDSFLLVGEENTNIANVTAQSLSGNTAAIPSAEGLTTIMNDLAQELTWDVDFDIDKFRAVKTQLEAVGVINKDVDFMVGTNLAASIETSMIEFLKTNSAGHTFYDMMNAVGFHVKEININSVKFNVMELHAFSNPQKFGLSTYGYRDTGYIFPKGEYTARIEGMGTGSEEMRLPHLTLGYPNFNGENRRRGIWVEPGVNGLQGMGSVVSNDDDGVRFYTMTHIMPIWNHMYKTIKVERSAGSGGGN